MKDYPLFVNPPETEFSGLMNLSDMMAFARGRPLMLGDRESANIQDRRDFANEDMLTRANAYLAGPIAGNIFKGLWAIGAQSKPPVTMQEIGNLLPQDDNRLPQFASPGMRR